FEGTPTYKTSKGERYEGKQKDRNDRLVSKIPTRLIVRDAYVIDNTYQLEDKAENVIDRLSGNATPRNMERVVSGAEFHLDMVMDVYTVDDENELLNMLTTCFQLLTYDYLGGSGSRGYGKVSLHDLDVLKLIFNMDGSKPQEKKMNYTFNITP
ncbi:MAG: type III-A CRISPR-associated RAMP protein Csm3, partial [Bacteroidota bacterium]